ncbi:hypothetical protein RJ639_004081 [Escallonia herrerae]|uniref:Peptidase A1 domain-containing protein n=1 Tax=Escallonia herrerae TaxID=1293975 RepID=A0AA88UZ88_9ASTE|nr:hypothetical protein RJ639_023566 [Escallonia herrerae]KAK3019836.1 hypothetical protein RJ639_004081 [Escallonia herrerae]
MASSLLSLLLVCFVFHINPSVSGRPSLPNVISLPVTKDETTLQYTTQIHMGTPHSPIKLVVDLGGQFLWIQRASRFVSSSHKPISSCSLHCSMASSHQSGTVTRVVATNTICSLTPENTITKLATAGELAEDIMAVDYVEERKMGAIPTVHPFLFSSAPSVLTKGLASGAKGMLGLGRTKISLPAQLANTLGLQRKFSLCLSSSEGVVLPGGGGTDISKSLMYTPLMSIPSEDYYIHVKSIKINSKRLSLNKSLFATRISTILPYTTMESTIYDILARAYIKTATFMNMTVVAPVAPFGVCFSSEGIENTPVGPAVPAIDLVLQSEMVKWRIHGRNSMVQVSDAVMCLGFLDGGLTPVASIAIGGYQLEENLLEFNLATSMLGFSSSLLMRQRSCSNLKLSESL